MEPTCEYETHTQPLGFFPPLSIKGKPSQTRSSSLQPAIQSPARNRRTPSMHSHAQMSPPLTPRGSRERLPEHTDPETVFYHYLRAFYHFHPSTTVSSSSEESSITIPINPGDVILVHSIHPNGWADGTLLASGARGWLPTNYCSPYDHDWIRSLLHALTQIWDSARSEESDNMAAFAKQDYVRAMIAGVRYLLDSSRCLNRDTPIITGHSGLRRARKGLLGELSSFVKVAKGIQFSLQQGTPNDALIGRLDELILKALRVVTRAVRFLDLWFQDIEQQNPLEYCGHSDRPLTPPTCIGDHQSNIYDDAGAESRRLMVAYGEDADEVRSEPPQSFASGSTASLVQPGTAMTTHVATRPSSTRYSLASHRTSYTANAQQRQNLASERLTAAQDAFLGSIASFVGGHLQSRSSSELLSTTQHSFDSGRSLLAVVDEVWMRDGRRSDDVREARDALDAKLTELIQAAKALFHTSGNAHDEEVFMPDEGKEVVVAATSCVRAAGDCVSKARSVMEKIGDFEFEHFGLGLSDYIFETARLTVESSSRDTEEKSKPLPLPPPQPENAPPPPPPPTSQTKPLPDTPLPETPIVEAFREHNANATIVESPTCGSLRSSRSSIPPFPHLPTPQLPPVEFSPTLPQDAESITHRFFGSTSIHLNGLTDTTSSSTYPNSNHDDGASVNSRPSTGATTPDRSPATAVTDRTSLASSVGHAERIGHASDACSLLEKEVLSKTYAHELIYNKDGQVSGGSLAALVEKLTTHEATPDALFVTAFYLTFRLFATPVEFAEALIYRFEYAGESQEIGTPVRLRVYNVFKGWLESHWKGDTDGPALGIIFSFATSQLRQTLPAAGKRLAELTAKVTEYRAGNTTPKLAAPIGKITVTPQQFMAGDKDVPAPNVSKGQMNILKNALSCGAIASILDFDPLELARQFTLIESKLFCSIQPEELLASEWTKKNAKAVNVRAMSTLSTDLANLVADTILQLEEPKKRAAVIKQWVKVSAKCLELANYDSLMAIICSLNSSMVLRLKRTWDCVSVKTKNKLEELKAVTDVSRNYAVLRQRLQNHVAPCIPFVGIYLTDLTFVDVGNQTTRQLPGDGATGGGSVINFDKHMKTAKIIGQLQSFQIPYRLVTVPEMQDWMQSQIHRVRSSDSSNVQSYYRRSLALEPREPQQPPKPSPTDSGVAMFSGYNRDSNNGSKDKFLNFSFSSSSSKEKIST